MAFSDFLSDEQKKRLNETNSQQPNNSLGENVNSNIDNNMQNDDILAQFVGAQNIAGYQQPQQQQPQEESGLGAYINNFIKGAKAQGAGALGGQADFVSGALGTDGAVGDYFQNVAQNNQRKTNYELKDILAHPLQYVTDPSGLIYDVGGGAGSSAVLGAEGAAIMAALPAGVTAGITGAIGTTAARFGLPWLAKTLESPAGKMLIGNVLKTPMEAISEGGNTYRGMTRNEDGTVNQNADTAAARRAMYADTAMNSALLTFTNSLESAGLGNIINASGGKGKVLSVLKAAIGDFLQNGYEEGAQQGIQNYAQGTGTARQILDPTQWNDDQLNQAFTGGITGLVQGGGMAAGGMAMNRMMGNNQQESNTPQENVQPEQDNTEYWGDVQRPEEYLAQRAENEKTSSAERMAIENILNAGNSQDIYDMAKRMGWEDGRIANEKNAFVNSIATQESGGNYNEVNEESGAIGKYQILPENWKQWAQDAGLPADAEPTPENQERVAQNKLEEYYDKYGARGAAIAWYAGEGALNYSEDALNRKQGDYPSINEYADSVVNRMGQDYQGFVNGVKQDNVQMGNFREAPIAEGIEDTGLANTDPNLVSGVNALNTWAYNTFGKDLIVSGGARSAEHNAEVNGSSTSHHLTGGAIDIDISNFTPDEQEAIMQKAQQMGFNDDGESMRHDRGTGDHMHLIMPSNGRINGAGIVNTAGLNRRGSGAVRTAADDYVDEYLNSLVNGDNTSVDWVAASQNPEAQELRQAIENSGTTGNAQDELAVQIADAEDELKAARQELLEAGRQAKAQNRPELKAAPAQKYREIKARRDKLVEQQKSRYTGRYAKRTNTNTTQFDTRNDEIAAATRSNGNAMRFNSQQYNNARDLEQARQNVTAQENARASTNAAIDALMAENAREQQADLRTDYATEPFMPSDYTRPSERTGMMNLSQAEQEITGQPTRADMSPERVARTKAGNNIVSMVNQGRQRLQQRQQQALDTEWYQAEHEKNMQGKTAAEVRANPKPNVLQAARSKTLQNVTMLAMQGDKKAQQTFSKMGKDVKAYLMQRQIDRLTADNERGENLTQGDQATEPFMPEAYLRLAKEGRGSEYENFRQIFEDKHKFNIEKDKDMPNVASLNDNEIKTAWAAAKDLPKDDKVRRAILKQIKDRGLTENDFQIVGNEIVPYTGRKETALAKVEKKNNGKKQYNGETLPSTEKKLTAVEKALVKYFMNAPDQFIAYFAEKKDGLLQAMRNGDISGERFREAVRYMDNVFNTVLPLVYNNGDFVGKAGTQRTTVETANNGNTTEETPTVEKVSEVENENNESGQNNGEQKVREGSEPTQGETSESGQNEADKVENIDETYAEGVNKLQDEYNGFKATKPIKDGDISRDYEDNEGYTAHVLYNGLDDREKYNDTYNVSLQPKGSNNAEVVFNDHVKLADIADTLEKLKAYKKKNTENNATSEETTSEQQPEEKQEARFKWANGSIYSDDPVRFGTITLANGEKQNVSARSNIEGKDGGNTYTVTISDSKNNVVYMDRNVNREDVSVNIDKYIETAENNETISANEYDSKYNVKAAIKSFPNSGGSLIPSKYRNSQGKNGVATMSDGTKAFTDTHMVALNFDEKKNAKLISKDSLSISGQSVEGVIKLAQKKYDKGELKQYNLVPAIFNDGNYNFCILKNGNDFCYVQAPYLQYFVKENGKDVAFYGSGRLGNVVVVNGKGDTVGVVTPLRISDDYNKVLDKYIEDGCPHREERARTSKEPNRTKEFAKIAQSAIDVVDEFKAKLENWKLEDKERYAFHKEFREYMTKAQQAAIKAYKAKESKDVGKEIENISERAYWVEKAKDVAHEADKKANGEDASKTFDETHKEQIEKWQKNNSLPTTEGEQVTDAYRTWTVANITKVDGHNVYHVTSENGKMDDYWTERTMTERLADGETQRAAEEERKQKQAEREREQAEKEKQEAAEKAKREDLQGFTDSMSDIQKAKVIDTLVYKGDKAKYRIDKDTVTKPMNRKEFIEYAVEHDLPVNSHTKGKRTEYWIDVESGSYPITKTAFDYYNYLAEKTQKNKAKEGFKDKLGDFVAKKADKGEPDYMQGYVNKDGQEVSISVDPDNKIVTLQGEWLNKFKTFDGLGQMDGTRGIDLPTLEVAENVLKTGEMPSTEKAFEYTLETRKMRDGEKAVKAAREKFKSEVKDFLANDGDMTALFDRQLADRKNYFTEKELKAIQEDVEKETTTENPQEEYKYYMNERGASLGTVPKGFTRVDENDKGGKYGAIYYAKPLSKAEIASYELTPDANNKKQDVIKDFGEYTFGARKDMYEGTGRTRSATPKKKQEDNKDVPEWRKPFTIRKDALMGGADKPYFIVFKPKAGGKTPYLYASLSRMNFATEEEAERAMKSAVFSQNFYVSSSTKNGKEEYIIEKKIGNYKYWPVKDGFSSKEEALKYVATNLDEVLATKSYYGENDLATPQIKEWRDARTGNAKDRLNGRNATAEMFAKEFGFRGVQFGNWNNQQERQELMNAAYEGMHDLADALGVPPKIISLNGELSLAFGARGQGLSGAKAHFEPKATIINLTKMKGAGALAHEWQHAVDQYLLIKGGLISNEREALGWLKDPNALRKASDLGYEFNRANLPEGLKTAFKNLMQSIMYKEENFTKDMNVIDKRINNNKEHLDKELNALREYIQKERQYSRKKKPATPEQLAKFDAAAQKFAQFDGETHWDPELQRWTCDALEELGNVLKEITGRGFAKGSSTADNLVSIIRMKRKLQETKADAEANSIGVKQVPTDFKAANIHLDDGRSTDYWTKPTEMLSRAFSAYIEDTLQEKGQTSDFLSYGSDNRLYPFGKPFPEGKERERINENFKAFYKEVAKEVQKNIEETGEIKFSLREAKNAYPSNVEQTNNVRTYGEVLDETLNAFPNAKISTDKNGQIVAELPNGAKFAVSIKDNIILNATDQATADKAHNTTGGTVQGSWEKVNGKGINGLLTVSRRSEVGTTYHEALHAAIDLALTEKEKNALFRYYAKQAENEGRDVEETVADAYRDWKLAREQHKGTLFGKLWQKVKDLATKFKALFDAGAEVQSIMQDIESGKVYERKINRNNPNAKFSINGGNFAETTFMPEEYLELQKEGRGSEYEKLYLHNKTMLGEGYKTESGKPLMDADKDEFIIRPNGSKAFGKITKEIEEATGGKLKTGEIRLKVGDLSKGLIHAKERHTEHVTSNGYDCIEDFIVDVAENFDEIYERKPKAEGLKSTFVLVKHNIQGKDKLHGIAPVYFELESDNNGNYYLIITSTPKDSRTLQREIKKETLIYHRAAIVPVASTSESAVDTSYSKNARAAEAEPTSESMNVSNDSVAQRGNNVKYSVRPTKQASISDAFSNTELSKSDVTQIKEGGFKSWVKSKTKGLYRDWIDKNDSLHGFDEAMSMALGKPISGDKSIYNRVQTLSSNVAGEAQALIEGNSDHIRAINEKLGLKGEKQLENASIKKALDIVATPVMNKVAPNYLKDNGFKNWVDAFGAYLGSRRLLEMAKLSRQAGKRYTFPKDHNGNQLTEQQLKEFVAKAPKQFSQAATEYYKVNNNVLKLMENAGLISSTTRKLLNQKYKEYCPLMRDFSDTAAADSFIEGLTNGGRGIVNVSSMLKHISIEGSEREVFNPLESTVKAIAVAANRCERNRVGQMAVQMVKDSHGALDGMIKEIPTPNGGNASADAKKMIFTVMQDGKKVAYQLSKDYEELYDPIVGYNVPAASTMFGIAKNAAQALRSGATLSPSFVVRNLIRDTIFAGISSKNGFIPFVDSVRGMYALWKNPKARAEFEASGVTAFNFYNHKETTYKDLIAMNGGKAIDWTKPSDIWKALTSKPEQISDFVESATRMGEFLKAREKNMSLEEAARSARELTLDFSRSGVQGEKYNQYVPFFNACLQGGDKLFRLFHEDFIGTSLKIAKYIVVPSMLLWAMNHDEDWYKELDPAIKNSNWCLPNGIRIPKPQEAGILFGSGIEALLDYVNGQDKRALGNWGKEYLSNMTPNYLPTLFLPIIEWQANYSFFRGNNVVSKKLQRLPDEKQFSNGTSTFSKAIGSATKLSPVKIDNTIRGYTGTMGMFLWQMGDFLEDKNAPEKKLSEYQFVRDFNVTQGNRSRYVNDFYDLLDAANKQQAGYGVKGKPTADISAIKKYGTIISGLNKDIQNITNNKNLSPERKRELIDNKKQRINDNARKAVEKYGDKYL